MRDTTANVITRGFINCHRRVIWPLALARENLVDRARSTYLIAAFIRTVMSRSFNEAAVRRWDAATTFCAPVIYRETTGFQPFHRVLHALQDYIPDKKFSIPLRFNCFFLQSQFYFLVPFPLNKTTMRQVVIKMTCIETSKNKCFLFLVTYASKYLYRRVIRIIRHVNNRPNRNR